MLYEVLTGRPPFADEPTARLLQNMLTADPLPPSRRVAEVDPRLEQIALRSLAKDPAKRYPSAREWRAELVRWRRGKPTAARPARRSVRWGWGNRGVRSRSSRSRRPAFHAASPMPRPPEERRRVVPAPYERAVGTLHLLARRVDEIAELSWRDGAVARAERIGRDARVLDLRKQLRSELPRPAFRRAGTCRGELRARTLGPGRPGTPPGRGRCSRKPRWKKRARRWRRSSWRRAGSRSRSAPPLRIGARSSVSSGPSSAPSAASPRNGTSRPSPPR
jgi:hypothetical protein